MQNTPETSANPPPPAFVNCCPCCRAPPVYPQCPPPPPPAVPETPTPVPDPPAPPTTTKFIFTENWNVTLPSEDPERENRPKTVHFPELETYNDEHYQITNDGIIMTAPVGGFTTPNSKNPRCEFRELTGPKTLAAWKSYQGLHNLKYVFSVLELPKKKPEICVVQVHDKDDDVFMVRVEGDKVVITGTAVKKLVKDKKNVLVQKLIPGQKYHVSITIKAGNCFVAVDDVGVGFMCRADGCYFKAGCYTQANLSNDVMGSKGSLLVSYLWVEHKN